MSLLLGNGDGSFQSAISLLAPDTPRSIAVADVDGDTVLDIVVGNLGSDNVSVLLGNGDGSFEAAVTFAAGDGPYSIAVADLDGDRVLDLVTANSSSNDVTVLINLPEPPQLLLTVAALATLAWLRGNSQSRVRA